MKIKINKDIFKKHISNVSKGIITYSHLYALKGILLEASESSLVIIVSDGFLSFKEEIENNKGIVIEEPGKVLAPAKIFKDVVDKMEKDFQIETDSSKMIVKSKLTYTEINLFKVEEYPRISFETFGKDIIVDAQEFKDMIKNVSFAAANDDKRQILNGVNIKVSRGKFVASATNSFRLAREVKNIDSQIEFNITVMSKKIRDFLPLDASGTITINVDDSKIISKIGSTIISSRIIDGIYPPIEKLLTSDFSSKIEVEASELEKNIDRVTLVSDSSRAVILLQCKESEFIIESKRSEIGNAISKIENYKFQGEPINIAFDNSFLKEAISKFRGKIKISFNGSHKPFIIKGESNPNLLQLIMPHRAF